MPPVPKVGVGSRSGNNARSMDPADEVHEEAEAEDAEDNRRHAGEVVDGDTDEAHQQALRRVLPEIECRQHPERHRDDAHEEHHHDGAEDGREDAALGVRLSRIAGEELPQAAGVDGRAAGRRQLVRGIHPVHVEHRLVLLRAVGGTQREPHPRGGLNRAGEPLFELSEPRAQGGLLLGKRQPARAQVRRGFRLLFEVQREGAQPRLLDSVVHAARSRRAPARESPLDRRTLWPREASVPPAPPRCRSRSGGRRPSAAQRARETGRTRAAPGRRRRRGIRAHDVVLVHPPEVGAREVAVPELELDPEALQIVRRCPARGSPRAS